MKSSLKLRLVGLAMILAVGLAQLSAQSAPSKEYIRFGDRVIAIENSPPVQGSTLTFGTPSTGVSLLSSSGTGTVSVTSTIAGAWSVSSDVGWFHLTGVSSGTGSGTSTIPYSFDSNTSPVSRNATLTLVGGPQPQTLVFGQAGTSGTLTLTPSSATVNSTASTVTMTFNVTSSASWTASSNAGWLTVTTPSGPTGTTALGYMYTNNAGATRQGIITVTSGAVSQNFTLTQNALGTFMVGPRVSYITKNASVQLSGYADGVVVPASSVAWSVVSGLGTVSSTGLYTAPNALTTANVRGIYQGQTSIVAIYVVTSVAHADVDSVTPISGSGNSATFSFVAHDPNGIAQLQDVTFHLGQFSTPVSNDCALLVGPYDPVAPAYVTSPSGSPLATFTPASMPTLVGTYCDVTVNQATTSRNTSINQISFGLPIILRTTAISGSKGIWAQAIDRLGLSGPAVQWGTYTITGAPTVGPLSPTTGIGASQTFTATYSYNPSTATSLNSAELLVNTSASFAGACDVKYDKVANLFYLRNDAGTGWSSGIAPGSSGTLQNSQCTFSGTGSSRTWTSNNLTLVIPLTFTMNTFFGAKLVYLQAVDNTSVSTIYEPLGSYTVDVAPVVTAVTPSSGAGMSQVFNFTATDQNGGNDINQIWAYFTGGGKACDVQYIKSTNSLYLYNDAGTGLLGPATPGSSTTLANSACTLYAAQTFLTQSGNDLTLTASLGFTSAFNGAKTFLVKAYDVWGFSTTWSSGTWTVGPTVPVVITTVPGGLALSADGGANCTAPCTFQWLVGSVHTITASTSPQTGGTGIQYVWSSWSDSGAASHSVTVPSSATTYTANFTTQYFLTTSVTPAGFGTISPPSGWFNSGSVVSVSATPNSGHQFSGFSGGLTGIITPQNVTMTGPTSVIANF